MSDNWITITAPNGDRWRAYHAAAPNPACPGIVVVQEIFGVNAALRTLADDMAAQGFSVLVPDLFWRIEPGLDLGYGEDDRKKAFALAERFDSSKGVEDIGVTADALRKLDDCNGKVAVVGFCLGGTLAYLAAARHQIDAGVIYYGTAVHKHLDEAGELGCPTLYHFGANDPFVTAEDVAGIRAGLAGRDDAQVHVYPEAGHAFCNVDRQGMYHQQAAELAHGRTLAFLAPLR